MAEELKVQYIKGNDIRQDEFIDFINYVFNFNGVENDFYQLLPKLYKKEYHPCENNYLVLENDRIKAAVGSFPGKAVVCGIPLTYYGIGNVAVNPYCRSKGYMRSLMNQAVEDMLIEDVDFSVLSGRRNRYGYFSYELAGRKYSFWIDESNIKHCFGKEKKDRFRFVAVGEKDKEILNEIADLQANQPLYYERDNNKLFDILKTWKSVNIYAIYEEVSLVGYLLFYDNNIVKEILLTREEELPEIIADFVLAYAKQGMNIELPEFQRHFIDSLSDMTENVSIQVNENFTVFHYDRVIEAFLKLKAQVDSLSDGEVTVLIHGKKKDECLNIKVISNQVTVTASDKPVDYEYSHQEAMSVFFHNYSPLRRKLPLEVQTWLPLPIYIFPADLV